MTDPGKPFRVESDKDGSFNELVVGKWFHMERMDEDWWWMRIGEQTYRAEILPDGTVLFENQEKEDYRDDPDLSICPNCGGPADNGFDRCLPPNPYDCTKCEGIDHNER